MRIGGDWCNCFALRGHDWDLDRMELDRIKYEAVRKDAARRCAEIIACVHGCGVAYNRILREFGLVPESTPESDSESTPKLTRMDYRGVIPPIGGY